MTSREKCLPRQLGRRLIIGQESAILPLLIAFSVLILSPHTEAQPAPSVVQGGSEEDFRPYCFTDSNGRPTGFGVDLLKAVADRMGLPLKITPMPWDEAWDKLVSSELDVLPVVARAPGRETLVDFGLPHTETFDAFFVRKGQPPIRDLADAEGKRIVVLRSDAAEHQLLDRNFAGTVIPVKSIPEGLRLVAKGDYDAFLCSKVIGVMELRAAGIKGIQAGPPIPDYKRVFSFAVHKGNSELLEKLNQGLLIVKSDGTYDRIYQRWLTVDQPWIKWAPYIRWLAAGLIAMVLVALALQLLVRKRTRQLRQANKEIEAELVRRRQAEESLRKLNTTLEERIAERTADLEQSRKAALDLARETAEARDEIQRTAAELQVTHDRFRVLTQNLQSGVGLIDEEGHFVIVNSAFLRMFDLEENSDIRNVNDRDWSQWQVFNENGALLDVDEHPVRKSVLTGRPVRGQLVAVRAPSASEMRWMLVSAEPILKANGKIDAIICTYHEVTQLKMAEEELRLARDQREEMYRREHHIASVLQQAVLPPHVLKELLGYEIAVAYKPAMKEADIGGDFFDVFELPDGKLAITIGDVAGKGLKAALRVTSARHSLRSYAYVHSEPGTAMTLANDALCRNTDGRPEMLTVFFAIIDPASETITYASAGHEPPVFVPADGGFEELKTGNLPLGLMQGTPYQQVVRPICSGDAVVMVTDGITEARSDNGELFGKSRLVGMVCDGGSADLQQMVNSILGAAIDHAKGQLQDDAAVVAFRRSKSGVAPDAQYGTTPNL